MQERLELELKLEGAADENKRIWKAVELLSRQVFVEAEEAVAEAAREPTMNHSLRVERLLGRLDAYGEVRKILNELK